MKEILLALLATSLETIGESKLIELLNKEFAKDPERTTLVVKGAYPLAVLFVDAAGDSKTPIDDAIAKALKEAIEGFAGANGIELPTT